MKKISLALLLGAVTLVACDDDTSMIGIDIMPPTDNVTAQTATYKLSSKTVKVDSVLANTSTCYLGSIVDPEMRVKTTCDFLAQFHLPEDFRLPSKERMLTNAKGQVMADSIDIRLYFEEYYGDSLNTMKLKVTELNPQKALEEGRPYYTDIDPKQYIAPGAQSKTVSYAVKDLSRPDTETDGTTYYRQVVVRLDSARGSQILQQYYDHPEHFTNSYQFIHNVCPGFYFEHAGGIGTMLTSKMMGMNLYFRYHTKTDADTDTIVDGIQRFGATEEVIQASRVENEYPGALTDAAAALQGGTYVKTPAALFTQLTLPVEEIVAGDYANDTISQAKLTIRKYNDEVESDNSLAAPTYLLLLPDTLKDKFFEDNMLPDSRSSYLSTAYSSSSNAYQFSNISQLISDLKHSAGVTDHMSEEERSARFAVWAEKHPDWNKVWLIPVEATFTTTTNAYGQQVSTLQRIRHQHSLSSAKLEGGKEGLDLQVIYTKYNR